jgi:hypothetical protein
VNQRERDGPGRALARGAWLGVLAGVGAAVLPKHLGLRSGPTARTGATAAMTVAWYTIGGLVAGGVYSILEGRRAGEAPGPRAVARPWS